MTVRNWFYFLQAICVLCMLVSAGIAVVMVRVLIQC